MAPTLYVIDGHAQFYRAYHAIRSAMSSPVTKEPTNLVFGFTGMLLKLLRDHRPDYLALVVDVASDTGTFRSTLYPEYKANREPPPDDFGPQVDRCIQLAEAMAIPVLGAPEVEADDVIATIVGRVLREHPELEVRIVSRDKDLSQLVEDRVELFDVHKGAAVVPEEIFKVPGVAPAHVADILALMGDSTDNVPGVPGIGPKTASQLILKYGSIDSIYEHLDELTSTRRRNLEASRERVRLSRRLVALVDDVEVDFALDQARCNLATLPLDDLLATFRELGFTRHGEDLRRIVQAGAPTQRTAVGGESSLFEGVGDQLDLPEGDYGMITTAEELDALVRRIREAGMCALDTETDDLRTERANLCGVSVSLEAGSGVYVPVRSPESDRHLDASTVLEAMRGVLEDESLLVIGHNLKFDLNILRRHGVTVACRLFDTMVASSLVDSSRSSHAMDVLALALLDRTCLPITVLIGRGKGLKTFDEVPLAHAMPYAAEDADVALQLHALLDRRLEDEGMRSLFDEVEMPLVRVLAELEFNGVHVDPEELARQRVCLEKRLGILRERIAEAAPGPLNPDSPRQLAAALFNDPGDDPPGFGLQPVRKGKTGPSTDQEVLERLSSDPEVETPLPGLVLEYRHLAKLVNTYLVALDAVIDPGTGRVHASFHQTVTATGRLSSSDPNLQNIPIRTEIGREIRRAFTAEPGHVLITADYSQVELRMLAHLSGDEGLARAFREGRDIHASAAAEIFDVAEDEVTEEHRTTAKMVNFGIAYGITPWGLARRLGAGTSVAEAEAIIERYRRRFPAIGTFLEACVAQARDEGHVTTILGRRRDIPQVYARHPVQRALGERMAINTVVQGSAADLIKVAMIRVHESMPGVCAGVRLILQIHDELVCEAPREEAPRVREHLVERMRTAMELDVPLVVETASSPCWIDAK